MGSGSQAEGGLLLHTLFFPILPGCLRQAGPGLGGARRVVLGCCSLPGSPRPVLLLPSFLINLQAETTLRCSQSLSGALAH